VAGRGLVAGTSCNQLCCFTIKQEAIMKPLCAGRVWALLLPQLHVSCGAASRWRAGQPSMHSMWSSVAKSGQPHWPCSCHTYGLFARIQAPVEALTSQCPSYTCSREQARIRDQTMVHSTCLRAGQRMGVLNEKKSTAADGSGEGWLGRVGHALQMVGGCPVGRARLHEKRVECQPRCACQ